MYVSVKEKTFYKYVKKNVNVIKKISNFFLLYYISLFYYILFLFYFISITIAKVICESVCHVYAYWVYYSRYIKRKLIRQYFIML
jgi:hypothetical protein